MEICEKTRCQNPVKYEFNGKKLCGVHYRSEMNRIKTKEQWERKREAQKALREQANILAGRLRDLGFEADLEYRDGYTGSVVLHAEDAEKLIKRLEGDHEAP